MRTDTDSRKLFLQQEIIPKHLVTYGCGIVRPFHIWCIGCSPDDVLEYIDVLMMFKKSIHMFRYRLLVSDNDQTRLQLLLSRLEEVCQHAGEIELKFEFLEIWDIAVRKTQDVIIVGQNLRDLTCGDPQSVLGDLNRLLFPGRFLLTKEELLSPNRELPLVHKDRYGCVFKRAG